MTATLLYQLLRLRGYGCTKVFDQGGRLGFCIEQPRDRLRCPQCGGDDVWSHGSVPRVFRSVPFGSKPVEIHFAVPRSTAATAGSSDR